MEEEQFLIEGCKSMLDENLRITEEFEDIEDLDKWEW